MVGLLIADKSAGFRKHMANLFIDSHYDVIVTDSAAKALGWILKNEARVVLISRELIESEALDLIHLMKKYDKTLTIILVSDDVPLPALRKFRREGIFYHSLHPDAGDDRSELLEAVHCAFQSAYGGTQSAGSAGRRPFGIPTNHVPERRQP